MQSKTISKPIASAAQRGDGQFMHESPQSYLLCNQQMASVLTNTGAGGVFFEQSAITRWHRDRTADAEGYFVFLRDLESGEFWSTCFQPTLVSPVEMDVSTRGQTIVFRRSDSGILSNMQVCMASDFNVELRRCTVINQTDSPRHIELTSYAELVLQAPLADAAHPAFSKLFVETELTEAGVLVARRRQRQAGDIAVSAAHFLAGSGGAAADAWETDRKRFIGRGQDLSRPRALQDSKQLTGTTGSVLDPIFSLRKILKLAPGASATVVFGLAASWDEQDLAAMATHYSDATTVEKAFQLAEELPSEPQQADAWDKSLRVDAAATSAREMHFHPENLDPSNGTASQEQETIRKYSPTAAQAMAEGSETSTNACEAWPPQVASEPLQFDNGWGGFSPDGKEYVIRVGPERGTASARPPLPWVNIIANEHLGFIVSESGAGATWSGNSRLNRLTPWHNDPVIDPHGESLFIRDEQRGVFWSPTPGPVPQNSAYEVRHGFGFTTFTHTSHDLRQEVLQFVPREDAVKITCVRLENLSDQPRKLTLFSYHQWALGEGGSQAAEHTRTKIHPDLSAVLATNNQRGVYSSNVAYATLLAGDSARDRHYSGDRREFLGLDGRLADPLALRSDRPLSGRDGANLDPCAACQATVEIQPGETFHYHVLLGESPNQDEAESVLNRYQTPEQCQLALAEVRDFWREKLSAVQVKTPSPAIDLMVNGWLPYQNLSCRLWGRTSTYQSGGAYGFRDQLQDSAAWIHHWPALFREQIIRNAAHQFVEGDVLHWWHPPTSQGIRTNFADDLLWLPLFAAEYVQSTGDDSLWREEVRYLTGPSVPAGEPEIYFTPEDSGESGTVYEHCCRVLDRGLTTGAHGLPLMGCGDWNDGMNRVGQAGTGESVWLGFFIDYILELFLPVCEQHDDHERAERYRQYRAKLRTALNDTGWDGEWYRRAYFDDGTPLGTAEADECQIDALVQAWAVMSGAAPADRAAQAMAAAESRLVDEQAGLIQLLDPPFNHMPNDPGYIKGYLPGIRENGGQYTHGILWFIRAVAELGNGSRAVELLEMISPVNHGRNEVEVNTYQAEPYVIAADVYSQAPHAGRAGWSWYTGSAGWMFRVAVESILGIQINNGNTLRIDPRISADWPECRVQYRLPDDKTCYDIAIQNPNGKQSGVTNVTLDGEDLVVSNQVAEISLKRDGGEHRVVVVL